MSHQQKRHERHEHDRKVKQAQRRQSAATFNKPGTALIGTRGYVIAGTCLCGVALLLWVVVTWL